MPLICSMPRVSLGLPVTGSNNVVPFDMAPSHGRKHLQEWQEVESEGCTSAKYENIIVDKIQEDTGVGSDE
jgi:hypothetical protein